jgi:hypothetical protein
VDCDDLIFAPKLLKPHYPMTVAAIQAAATKIANARRVQLAVAEVSGAKGEKAAGDSKLEEAVVKVPKRGQGRH